MKLSFPTPLPVLRLSAVASLRARRLFAAGLITVATGASSDSARAQTAIPSYTFVDLGPVLGQGVAGLAGKDTAARGINDSRVVVGEGDADRVAWRYSAGAVTQVITGGPAVATAINNAGVIVGRRELGDAASNPNMTETTAAVRYENGTLQTIVSSPGQYAKASAVSNAGHIVGEIENSISKISPGFLWFQGTTTLIGAANSGTQADGVNDAGDVVGNSIKPGASDGTAFLWRNGTLTYLTEGFSRADDINNHGVIVGNGDADDAFKYVNGTLTRLGRLPGFDRHQPLAINDTGTIVGLAESFTQFARSAVVWFNDQPHALSSVVKVPAGWELNEASAINAHGDIVGHGVFGDQQRAFLLLANPTISLAATPARGGQAVLTVQAGAATGSTFQWQRNGTAISNAVSGTLTLNDVQPASAGLYHATLTSGATSTSDPAIVGVATSEKAIGAGTEIGFNIFVATNNNTFDQVQLSGAAATITADANQITRISFVDLTDDIVQVEFSGAGTLSLVLDNPTGPAVAVNYNQPTVSYMKGHAGIVIMGANETTNVGIFSVGRITAVNQALFSKPIEGYDGLADVAFIAISTTNGKFGGVRTANANYYATKGLTGLYAPGVQFSGPVFIGDINAFDTATPVLRIGSSPDTRITGGDLLQANAQPVRVNGLTQLKFTAGSTSHVASGLSAKANRAQLLQDGVDITTQVVVNP